jgi:hypothetical protein
VSFCVCVSVRERERDQYIVKKNEKEKRGFYMRGGIEGLGV